MNAKNIINPTTALLIFTQENVSYNVLKTNLQSKITIPENVNTDALY